MFVITNSILYVVIVQYSTDKVKIAIVWSFALNGCKSFSILLIPVCKKCLKKHEQHLMYLSTCFQSLVFFHY